MNLKKFVFSSLGAAALVSGSTAQAGLLGLSPVIGEPFINAAGLTGDYNVGTGVFSASTTNAVFDFSDIVDPVIDAPFLGTFNLTAYVNSSNPTTPLLTGGTFTLTDNASSDLVLSGILRTGPLGTTWGAADSSASAASKDLFEYTFSITGGAFYDDFIAANTLGLGGMVLDFDFANNASAPDYAGVWNQPFSNSNPVVSVQIFTDASFVPEPTGAVVAVLLVAGVAGNRRRSLKTATAP